MSITTRKRGRLGRSLALGLLALLLLTGIPAAHADLCSACPTPTETDVEASGNFTLEVRDGPFDSYAKDYIRYTTGECLVAFDGDPVIEKVNPILVERARGSVWNCPHSSSSGTITASAAASDISEWSISAEAGLSAKFFGATVSAKIAAAVKEAQAFTVTTTVSQMLSAKYCHRVPWCAFFEVSDFKASVKVQVSRAYHWWTGNVWTGREVHRDGDLTLPCGGGMVVLTRRAPFSAYFHLSQKPCSDPACSHVVARHLDFFPQLPPHLKTPEGWEPPDLTDPDTVPAPADTESPVGESPPTEEPPIEEPVPGEATEPEAESAEPDDTPKVGE